MADRIAGEFELPAWFGNESNWIFNLWNSNLISKSKAESFVAVDSRRFKIWNLRRKDLPEVGQFLGMNGTARADKGGILRRKKEKKKYPEENKRSWIKTVKKISKNNNRDPRFGQWLNK